MNPEQMVVDLETLARIAARLAGRDPDEPIEIRIGEVVAFEGPAWRYSDFLDRAEAAYALLGTASTSSSSSLFTTLALYNQPEFRSPDQAAAELLRLVLDESQAAIKRCEELIAMIEQERRLRSDR